MVNSLILKNVKFINGVINLPGSKSISNRALLLSSLAEGVTKLSNLLDSEDVNYMLHALRKIGVNIDEYLCNIIGTVSIFKKKKMKLYIGNAGTAMRSLTAVFCLFKGNIILTGDSRMKERPIGHLVEALLQGGAKINYIKKKKFPPLLISGVFSGGSITVNGSISSQFLTALLIASPLSHFDTYIYMKGNVVSKPYIEMTLLLMCNFGIKVQNTNYNIFYIKGKQYYRSPGNYHVEGDASSASYLLAAAAIKGGTVRVNGIGKKSMQGDIKFSNILEKMGAKITWNDNFMECSNGKLQGIDMDMNDIPDAAMTIASTALFAKGETIIRNIYNWRVKETNRILAMATELRKVGAIVEAGKDFINIIPPVRLKIAEINTYNDHRMAMCFSLVALSNIPVIILNPNCIKKTFPKFFQKWKLLTEL